MFRLLSVCILTLTLSVLSGCGKDDTTASNAPALPDAGAMPTDAQSTVDSLSGKSGDAVADSISDTVRTLSNPIASAPDKPAWPAREGLTGNWLLHVFQVLPSQEQDVPPQIGERPAVLFRLEPGQDDTADALEIVAVRDEFDVATEVSGTLEEDRLEIECKRADGNRAFLFEGRRAEDGCVVGSIVFANGSAQSARLIPTDERTFVRVPKFVVLTEAIEMMRLASSPVLDEDTRLFVEKYPTSPIAAIAWKQLIQMTAQKEGASEGLTKLVDEYCSLQARWSDRLHRIALVETFVIMGAGGGYPDWCLPRVDMVNAAIDEDPELASLKLQVKQVTMECRFRQTLGLFDSDKDEDKERGEVLAVEMLKERPHEPSLVLALADQARARGDIDRAIELYAELVALPFQERILQQRYAQSAVQKILPTERLSMLWKEKHGSTEGLDDFIQKSYDRHLLDFVADTFDERPADSGTHTVLLELFTGTRSPLCITADTVLAAMDRTYPTSMVVSLRYHLHIPEFDPLTNEDNEARFFNYYRSQGTPALFLNGVPVAGIIGTVSDAPARYNDIRNMLADQYSKESEIAINLSATRQGDQIEISANVDGADLSNDRLRLRLVLAENEVPFLGLTGIRSHSMVARKMIGGDRGIAAADGKLGWQGMIDVNEVRDTLHAYLTNYEQNFGIEFSSMPLDLESLSLIAFVQDDATRRVLQTRLVRLQTGAPAKNE
jgi:hypothetical protein